MKKIKILFMFFVSTLLLSSCATKSNEVEQLYGKRYGAVGSGISVIKKSKLYSVLYFTLPENATFKDSTKENVSGGYFDYPKVIRKNGKKYLTAEGLPDDRFEIVSENVILDNYTGYEFTHYDRVPDKEMEKYYGNVYEGPKGGTVEIVKKTEDYSFISFKLPMNEEFEYKGEGPKIMGGVYDNPSIVTIGDKRYLRADNLEEKRLEIVNDNVILDTKTGYEFGLKNLSKK
ncbi:hypothetical protein VJI72_04540 [Parvimonas micra]|uniref:hypothetical protein n=1 Tax=Parvimonas micra TaxID=33033 RepID=UPI002B4916E7|nr:hypothetical protein [Parvimonas micra]MEB3029059.1 hypothetical protein [Parvimonas micra]